MNVQSSSKKILHISKTTHFIISNHFNIKNHFKFKKNPLVQNVLNVEDFQTRKASQFVKVRGWCEPWIMIQQIVKL
jgi:hypothetical protein